jgi:hypothetical protein
MYKCSIQNVHMVGMNDAKTFVDKTRYIYIYIIFIFFTCHAYLSRHDLKKIQFMIPQLEKKRSCMMMWHFSPCHINLGPHNIHVKIFKLEIT